MEMSLSDWLKLPQSQRRFARRRRYAYVLGCWHPVVIVQPATKGNRWRHDAAEQLRSKRPAAR